MSTCEEQKILNKLEQIFEADLKWKANGVANNVALSSNIVPLKDNNTIHILQFKKKSCERLYDKDKRLRQNPSFPTTRKVLEYFAMNS